MNLDLGMNCLWNSGTIPVLQRVLQITWIFHRRKMIVRRKFIQCGKITGISRAVGLLNMGSNMFNANAVLI